MSSYFKTAVELIVDDGVDVVGDCEELEDLEFFLIQNELIRVLSFNFFQVGLSQLVILVVYHRRDFYHLVTACLPARMHE